MPTTTTTTTSNPRLLTTDDIDDLIYACRTNALDWLREWIPKWSEQLKVPDAEVIKNAIDVDEEGLGSRTCLLHYPAANGNLEMIQYLLERLKPSPTETQVNGQKSNGDNGQEAAPRTTHASENLVNHQNVSGNTPLHWAALNGHIEVVKALVGAGADPTIVNEAGRDAVVEAEYSAKDGGVECATWMLKECEALEKGAGGIPQADDGLDENDVEVDADEKEEEQHINGQPKQ